MRIKLVFQGVPQAVQSARFANVGGHIRSFQPKAVVNWKAWIKLQAQQQLPKGYKRMTGTVRIEKMVFIFPPLKGWSKRKLAKLEAGGVLLKNTRPDVDNLGKGFYDSLTGVVWDDDALIGEVCSIRKRYGLNPGIELVIAEVAVDEDGFLVEPTTFGF